MIIKPKKLIDLLASDELRVDFVKTGHGDYSCTIYYLGNIFTGTAHCHPEDKDFDSEKVGCSIAHMRAMKSLFNHQKKIAKVEYDMVNNFVSNIFQNQDLDDVDPTFRMRKALFRAENKYIQYAMLEKEAENSIRTYTKDQDKVITSIKRQRGQKRLIDSL